MIFHSNSSDETIALGKKVGAKLNPGNVVGFYGELGSGKTTMIKGVCIGLGVKKQNIVKSPSFIMINEYQGRYPIYHIDLYRIKNTEEILSIGFDEYLYGNGVSLIEWAEKAEKELPDKIIKIELEAISIKERNIKISGLKSPI